MSAGSPTLGCLCDLRNSASYFGVKLEGASELHSKYQSNAASYSAEASSWNSTKKSVGIGKLR